MHLENVYSFKVASCVFLCYFRTTFACRTWNKGLIFHYSTASTNQGKLNFKWCYFTLINFALEVLWHWKAQSSTCGQEETAFYLFLPPRQPRLAFVLSKCFCPTFRHPGSFQPPWHVSPSLFWGLNAKWWSDKTLSIKMCFMTTWDSWPVLECENIWGSEAKDSRRDWTANLTWLRMRRKTLTHNSRLFSWE